MAETMKIALAQIHSQVGATKKNLNKIIEYYTRALDKKCNLIIFPEACLSGYPAGDLWLNRSFLQEIAEAVTELRKIVKPECALLIGAPLKPSQGGTKPNNSAILITSSDTQQYNKRHLPQYRVFDEERFFTASQLEEVKPMELNGRKLGVMVCEDLWHVDVTKRLAEQNAEVLLVLNSSPYEIDKIRRRLALAKERCHSTSLPLIYVNNIGAQDGIVFDGHSFVLDAKGNLVLQLQGWNEEFAVIDLDKFPAPIVEPTLSSPKPVILQENELENVYQALVLGLRHYMEDNNREKVVLGLSGGIDSALVMTIACDALGAEKVRGIAMPSEFSSQGSLDDASALAKNLGTKLHNISIQNLFTEFKQELGKEFSEDIRNLTQENLQARIRAILLMGFANQYDDLLLTTGNKSEIAVGYCTIYGDMCGAYAPIKDIYKTQVYQLSKWRNNSIPAHSKAPILNIIPPTCLTKAPSAELAPNQCDQDTLPPYDVLDNIIYHLVEQDLGVIESTAAGLDKTLVEHISQALINSEYKRSQSPIGTKISVRELGRDRRYPITNGYKG
jgi:NAD+ synthase